MRAQILAAVRAVVVFTVLLGLAYPLAMTLISQVAFGDEADGSLVRRDGEVVGSELLGQTFTSPEYFHGRPSAAGGGASGSEIDVLDPDGEPTGETMLASADDISTAASGASNLGPTNEDLLATIEERIATYRDENGLDDDALVPVDAVTASGSGVDPHISVANARLQAARVADERGLSEDEVLALVDDHTTGRALGFLGEKGVNVLELNLALDEQAPVS
jgi:potassium-transporting ATPase KdpC subunit